MWKFSPPSPLDFVVNGKNKLGGAEKCVELYLFVPKMGN